MPDMPIIAAESHIDVWLIALMKFSFLLKQKNFSKQDLVLLRALKNGFPMSSCVLALELWTSSELSKC